MERIENLQNSDYLPKHTGFFLSSIKKSGTGSLRLAGGLYPPQGPRLLPAHCSAILGILQSPRGSGCSLECRSSS